VTVAQDKTGVGAGSMEWRTPPDLFEWLNRRFQFDYDAFASHENALCDEYSTIDGTYTKTLPSSDAEDSQCLSCGAQSAGLNSPLMPNISGLTPRKETASIVTVGSATERIRASGNAGGDLTPLSESDYSLKSGASQNPSEGELGSGQLLSSTITSGDIQSMRGLGNSGSPPSPIGAVAPTAVSVRTNLSRIMSSRSPMAPAQEPSLGTSSQPASSAPEARGSAYSMSGLPPRSSGECSHIWKVNDNNGLVNSWRSRRTWINPPYSRGLIEQCIEKAYNERNNAAIIVALIPASTETQWFQRYILPTCHIEWLPRRVRFIDPATGEPGQSPPSGSVIAIFRQDYQ
jgi:hypothetical protein